MTPHPIINPAPNARPGLVSALSTYTADVFRPGSVIMCRNNAPLVAFAYALIQRDVPCRILGRDIGEQLIDVVKKRRAASLDDLILKLGVWRDREYQRAIENDKSPERISDQYACLMVFIDSLDDDSRSVTDLICKIELMFCKDVAGAANKVLLSSVHKFKGKETNLAFILDRAKLMPSKYAKTPEQLKQEYNLLYVAVTRSKDVLHYISSDCWQE